MAGRSRQLGFQFRTRGGARAGAGRPPKDGAPGVSHLRRPAHSARHPVHVTLRVQRGLSSLRERRVFRVVQRALADGKEHFGFTLVHFSVQSNHLHLIAEASDRRALSRGVQGLSIRIARAANRELERKGRLFADRYHARALTSPRSVRFALRYVLLNARKHTSVTPAGFVDSCSSAPWFHGFGRPAELAFGARQARAEWARRCGSSEPPVVSARSWLLRIGQRKMGDFDLDEVPAGVR